MWRDRSASWANAAIARYIHRISCGDCGVFSLHRQCQRTAAHVQTLNPCPFIFNQIHGGACHKSYQLSVIEIHCIANWWCAKS